VADLFYTVPFLICLLVALIAKNSSPRRIKWNKAGLWISSLYLVFVIVNKLYVTSTIENALLEKKLPTADFITTPSPLNNFLWMAYSVDKTGYWFGYYSNFDKTKNVDFYHVNKKNNLLVPFESDQSVKILKQFSKGYYVMSEHDSAVYFNDIRFGQMGGWDKPDSAFVFSFKLNRNADNSMALNRSRFKTSFSDAFASLYNRIKGR
jgi:inner membrane protein